MAKKNKKKNKFKKQQKLNMKRIKDLTKKALKAQRKVRQSCPHRDAKKSFLVDKRMENNIKVATCSLCNSKVIIDPKILNNPNELQEALLVITSKLSLIAGSAMVKGSVYGKLSGEQQMNILQVRTDLEDIINADIKLINDYCNDDHEDDDMTDVYRSKKSIKRIYGNH